MPPVDRWVTLTVRRRGRADCRRVQAPAARDADDDIIEPSPDA